MSRAHVVIVQENEPFPHDRRVRQEAEALRDAGYAVTVCGPTGFGFDAPRETITGIEVRRFKAPPAGENALAYLAEYPVALTRAARTLLRVHAERSVDVVMFAAPPDLMVTAALLLRRKGAAVVIDHRDLSPELFEVKFERRGPLYAALRRVERFAFRHSDAVVSTNETYAGIARTRGGVDPERIFIAGNGPDPAAIYPVPPNEDLKRGRPHLVCWAGFMAAQEGLEHLVDAADDLVRGRGRTDITWAMVGPGDARDRLMEDVERRGLADYFDFPGRVGDVPLREYMSTADVCVSVDQPSPMNDASTMTKVLEYMTMGRPIVQFPLAETSRQCGDASLYARPGDARDLADKIVELLDNPVAAKAMGERGRARALDGLVWPAQSPNLVEAIRTALRVRARS